MAMIVVGDRPVRAERDIRIGPAFAKIIAGHIESGDKDRALAMLNTFTGGGERKEGALKMLCKAAKIEGYEVRYAPDFDLELDGQNLIVTVRDRTGGETRTSYLFER